MHPDIVFKCQPDATWTVWFRGRVCMTGVSWRDLDAELEALHELFGLAR